MTQLLLDVACPNCGTRPNFRPYPLLVELVAAADPEHVIATWRCQADRCEGPVVFITVRMVQRALAAPSLTQDPSHG